MDVRVVKFLTGECNIHGWTYFYIYKNKPHKCVICTKEKSKEWKSKNKEYGKKYLVEWSIKNPDKVKEYKRKVKEYKRKKTVKKHDDFYEKFGVYIKNTASDIGLGKIPPSVKHVKNPTNDKILDYLLKAKRSELRSYEIFRTSTIVKWRHLKSHNLKSATEEQKSIIREEYKREAEKIVDVQMRKILEKYNK